MKPETEEAKVSIALKFLQVAKRINQNRAHEDRQDKAKKGRRSNVGKAICE